LGLGRRKKKNEREREREREREEIDGFKNTVCVKVFNTASVREGLNRTVVFWLRKKSDGCGEIRGITQIDDMACEKIFQMVW
jgi:hypothetical protein